MLLHECRSKTVKSSSTSKTPLTEHPLKEMSASSYSSSVRALSTILERVSHGGGAPFKYPIPSFSSLTCSGWIPKRLSSSSSSIWAASKLQLSQFDEYNNNYPYQFVVRKIWTSSPLFMGRRSSKIATRKMQSHKNVMPGDSHTSILNDLKCMILHEQGAQDLKKAKLYSKIGKEVVSAVKKGGPSPVSNSALAAVLEKAKELDVPKEIVERNIKKASEKGQEAYIEKFYEVYGYGGVGFVVEVLTDKLNRSVAAIRSVVKDYGGKMADSGSVMFTFKRARIVNVKVSDTDKDQLLGLALDAGAEDVIELPDEEDDSEEDNSERYYKIVSSPENYSTILSKLRDEGISFEPDNGFELVPMTPIEMPCIQIRNKRKA